jgi:hypothetical protein
VKTVLISAGVSLVVALISAAAQILAARRAARNSLALFEQQRLADEQARQELAEREDTYRFADPRQTSYREFLRVTAALVRAWPEATEATAAFGRFHERLAVEGVLARWRTDDEKDPDGDIANRGEQPDPEWIRQESEKLQARRDEASEQWQRLLASAQDTAADIDVIASSSVRRAADGFLRVATSRSPLTRILLAGCTHSGMFGRDAMPALDSEGLDDAREKFLEAVRRELGVGGDELLPAERHDRMPHSPAAPRPGAGSHSAFGQ